MTRDMNLNGAGGLKPAGAPGAKVPGLQAFVVLAALLATAAPAFAQITPRTPRPDWALFGSGVANTEQRLILTANFGGGYEDDLTKFPANLPSTPDASQQAYTGPFGTAGAALSYTVDKEGLRGGLSFGAYGRNYREQEEQPFVGTYSLNGNIGWAVSSRGSLSATFWGGQYVQNLAQGYSPGMGGPSYPGVPAMPGGAGVYTNGDTYIGGGTNVSYEHRISSSISAYGGWSYYVNDAWEDTENSTGTYDSQSANAGLRYQIGKGFSARAGYGATLGGFSGDDSDYRGRTIDLGVDYSGTLSPTRRSTLTFTTGLSGLTDQTGTTHYYFVGTANYNYEIGRTWMAGIGATRGTDFYQTLGQPAVTDMVNGSVGGSVGRRVMLSFGGGWYRGTYAGAESEAYTSTSASASVQYAISRMWSFGGTYYYYRYEYGEDAIVPPGFSQQLDRQSVVVTLNMFLPLYTKARRPSATR
jgi:hypothetical protein